MRGRENEAPMPEPLAYFITCSTYGTWLPGDERGWADFHHGWHLPDPVLQLEAKARMSEDACRLSLQQRRAVEAQIAETCGHYGWQLLVVNCRSNHMHIVVTAQVSPQVARSRLKAWATRRLKLLDNASQRKNWWAERGSQRWINDEESLSAAIAYVRDGQDRKY